MTRADFMQPAEAVREASRLAAQDRRAVIVAPDVSPFRELQGMSIDLIELDGADYFENLDIQRVISDVADDAVVILVTERYA